MKFGRTLTSEQQSKDSNSELDSAMEAGHRLSADDYDFDEEVSWECGNGARPHNRYAILTRRFTPWLAPVACCRTGA